MRYAKVFCRFFITRIKRSFRFLMRFCVNARGMAASSKLKTKSAAKKDIAASYNRPKDFNGRQYTGMAIGRTHHWDYDKADWKEKKIAPDKWEFAYSTIK